MAQINRLQDAVMNLIEYYSLPLGEVRAILYYEDYPPLEPGDLGIHEEVFAYDRDGGWLL